MEIRYYWEIVKKWIWLLALGLVLGAAGGYLLTYYQAPVFAASTKVMISQPNSGSSVDFYSSYNAEQLAQTYIQILTTQPILDALAQELGYTISVNQVSARLITGTRVLQITVEASHPQNAADIANGLVRVLTVQNETLQSGQFTTSESSLQAQISQVEAQITDTQNQIAELEETVVNESTETISGKLAGIQMEINTLETQLVDKNSEIIALELQLKTLKEYNSYTGRSNGTDEEIADINTQLFKQQLDLEELRATLNFYRQEYFDLLMIDENQSVAGSNNSQLQQLKSTLALYQQMYSTLLGNYENVRLERLRNSSTIVQVEAATADYTPIRPVLLNNIGLGAALGLMLAGGIVFLIEYLNDTIQLPEQVEALCDFPVVGVIADIPKEYRDTVLMHEKPRSPLVESFRILRTNIELIQKDNNTEFKSILIVSPNPGDGKSTISTNLATAYSQQGRKTLLVDADLRKPMVHRLFHLKNENGFSLLLRDGLTRDNISAAVQMVGRNLMVMPSGIINDDTADMITEQAPVFVKKFRGAADRIIFDCPPVLFAETFTLAKEVDGVIVVVKPGETKINALKRLIDQMTWINAKVIGIVFNQVSERKHGYYYQHYYSAYGYQYSRKYYHEQQQSNPSKPATAEMTQTPEEPLQPTAE
ncbi:MAG: polysaccharide biosynthesis tyrosine autokinase [Anaerolineae bacterium]|nr:polysaccharide biosynthesis tyrosine autokinase [Anaerolineae bacterium]